MRVLGGNNCSGDVSLSMLDSQTKAIITTVLLRQAPIVAHAVRLLSCQFTCFGVGMAILRANA